MRARVLALIALALGIVAAVLITRHEAVRTVQRARTLLVHGAGLREGATVTYRGIEVGAVTRLTFDSNGIAVDLAFHRPVPLRTHDTITLHTLGLIGDRAIDIVPGPSASPLLPDSGFLAARPPRPDIPAEDWLKALRPPPETVYRDAPRPPSRP